MQPNVHFLSYIWKVCAKISKIIINFDVFRKKTLSEKQKWFVTFSEMKNQNTMTSQKDSFQINTKYSESSEILMREKYKVKSIILNFQTSKKWKQMVCSTKTWTKRKSNFWNLKGNTITSDASCAIALDFFDNLIFDINEMGRKCQETATNNILAEINGLGETIKTKRSAPFEIIAPCQDYILSS